MKRNEAKCRAVRNALLADYFSSFPAPRFKVGDRIDGPFYGTATVMSASKGETPRSACTYSVRTDRGVIHAVNEDQPLTLVTP